MMIPNELKSYYLNFPRSLFKYYTHLDFHRVGNNSLEAHSNGCIFSISQVSQRELMKPWSDCLLALINTCSGYFNELELKFNHQNFPRALYKDYICWNFQTFANKSLEALSNACISTQYSHYKHLAWLFTGTYQYLLRRLQWWFQWNWNFIFKLSKGTF